MCRRASWLKEDVELIPREAKGLLLFIRPLWNLREDMCREQVDGGASRGARVSVTAGGPRKYQLRRRLVVQSRCKSRRNSRPFQPMRWAT